ncbi:MAG: acetyltransferase [Chromatiales bacterium]|nr:acetyltransferase [Chromatiales bacterium]
MKKPLVVFGSGDLAELARFYFHTDSEYEVVAFTLDGSYIREPSLGGLPMVPFEDVQAAFPPATHSFFVALSYARVNALRKEKYLAAKARGYSLVSYVSSKATVLNDGRIGDNCFILEDNTIQPFVTVGSNITMWSGNHIGHHSQIGDHTFIASHAVISGGVTIGEQCFIGVNATLRDHITVGDRCVIGAGTLLLGNADPDGLYIGQATARAGIPGTQLRSI